MILAKALMFRQRLLLKNDNCCHLTASSVRYRHSKSGLTMALAALVSEL